MIINITKPIHRAAIEQLEELGHKVIVRENLQQELCYESDALITMLSDNVDKSFIDQFPNLKVITNYAVGFNNIDIEHCKTKGIKVGNTPDVLTTATAELCLALLMAASKNFKQANDNVQNNEWNTWEPLGFLGMELKGKTLGIFGMGRIGQEFAKICHYGLGMNVIYSSRSEKDLDYAKKVDFDSLLKNSDTISLHSPLTEETKSLFDIKTFRKMKKGSIFINTARGEMHVQKDLLESIDNNHIFSAGLDVTSPEPTTIDCKIVKHPKVFITPHIGSATFESRKNMASICAQNIINVFDGNEPKCSVY